MIFKVIRTSDWTDDEAKFESLSTLEELLDFVVETPYPVILHCRKDSKTKILEIYDDWRE